MRFLLIFMGMVLLFGTCRDDDVPPPPVSPYDKYVTEIENPIFRERLSSPSPIGPFYFNKDRYGYWFPAFNPQNPYEVAYLRYDDELHSDCNEELFVFDFHTGETQLVAENACYSLSWSVKGWLIFTGKDRNVWKVKSNGDSLTQLTDSPGFDNYPTWNTSGDLFSTKGKIFSDNGNWISDFAEPFGALAWKDENTLIGSHQDVNKGIVAYDISSQETSSLVPGEKLLDIGYYRPMQNDIFVQPVLKRHKYFMRFDLTDQTIDTVRKAFFTHSYGLGDYSSTTDRAIIQLIRREWRDSAKNEIYIRRHLVMLDKDGVELGMIHLPE